MAIQIHQKISASVLAGAVTGIVISECARRGITISGDEGSNITLVLMAAAGFLMPSADQVDVAPAAPPVAPLPAPAP